jgi:hypothetical protein
MRFQLKSLLTGTEASGLISEVGLLTEVVFRGSTVLATATEKRRVFFFNAFTQYTYLTSRLPETPQ